MRHHKQASSRRRGRGQLLHAAAARAASRDDGRDGHHTAGWPRDRPRLKAKPRALRRGPLDLVAGRFGHPACHVLPLSPSPSTKVAGGGRAPHTRLWRLVVAAPWPDAGGHGRVAGMEDCREALPRRARGTPSGRVLSCFAASRVNEAAALVAAGTTSARGAARRAARA